MVVESEGNKGRGGAPIIEAPSAGWGGGFGVLWGGGGGFFCLGDGRPNRKERGTERQCSLLFEGRKNRS